ncbi:MAG: hypothetical protein IPK42_06035 [Betaproteobacteria bacterium]|nr:hypothetical protein [Betaproteobacteria bacterium]
MDFTVSTRAIVNALYVNLPANGSELVPFDINRNTKFGPLLPSNTETVLARLLPDAPRTFRTTVITNVNADSAEVVERVTEAGSTTEQSRALGLTYPREVFSLSHLALSFPMNDSLYGMTPDAPPSTAFTWVPWRRGANAESSSSAWTRCPGCRRTPSFPTCSNASKRVSARAARVAKPHPGARRCHHSNLGRS